MKKKKSNKLKKFKSFSTTKLLTSKRINYLIDGFNIHYTQTWIEMMNAGKMLVDLNKELKKENFVSLPEVKKKLNVTWTHAQRLIKIFDSPLLKSPQTRKRLPQSTGTLLVLARTEHQKKAMKHKKWIVEVDPVTKKETKRFGYMVRPEMVRSELEEFILEEEKKKNKGSSSLTNINSKFDSVDITINISVDKRIDKTYLNNKIEELTGSLKDVASKEFKVTLDTTGKKNNIQSRFGKFLKKKGTKKKYKK